MSNAAQDQRPDDAPAPPFSVRWIEDGAVFVIERPGKLNALTRPVLDGLAACIDALEARGARLLVILGSGERAFCAGTDVAELQGMQLEARLTKSAMARSLFVRIARSRIVSIAAINGLAFGGGLELAMACTLRISAPQATFSLPEIKLGLVPAYAGTQFLPALIGPARALELMLTGRAVGAEEALAIGLVHRVAPDTGVLVDAALAFAREVTRYSPAAIEAIRRCVDASGTLVTEAGLAAEGQHVKAVFGSADAHEGVTAFLEKRPVRF